MRMSPIDAIIAFSAFYILCFIIGWGDCDNIVRERKIHPSWKRYPERGDRRMNRQEFKNAVIESFEENVIIIRLVNGKRVRITPEYYEDETAGFAIEYIDSNKKLER
jgi:hypothetical protein